MRGLVLALALLAAVAGGAAFTRHLVLDRAARVLAGWQDAGLPGSAPRGDGPRLVGIWPPRLRWDDVTWTDSGGATLRCDHLVLEIEPSRLFGRSLRLRAISVSQLEWETSPPRSRWISPFLASLPSQEPPGLEDPPPRAIRFSIDGFRIAPGPLEIGSLEGWAASPRRGSWSLRARGSTPEGRGWSIRGMGSGYRGEANLTLETVLGPDRSLQIGLARTGVATASDAAASDAEATGDHATGDQATGDQATGDQVVGDKRWSWDLTARDDGTLLTSLLADPPTDPPADPPAGAASTGGAWAFHGPIDVTASGASGRPAQVEANLGGLEVRHGSDPPLTLHGLLCLDDSVASAQDLLVLGRSLSLTVDLDAPLAIAGGAGACEIEGEWDGTAVEANGTIERNGSGWVVRFPSIRRGEAIAGPSEILLGGNGPVEGIGALLGGKVRANVQIGPGWIRFEGGRGTEAEPAMLRGHAIPMPLLVPWLPFSLPGTWSGRLEAVAAVERGPEGWRASGTAALEEGGVRELPLLAEIASVSGRSDRELRFDHVQTSWTYAAGSLRADSLSMEGRTLRLSGTVLYFAPDSLLGLLSLSSKDDRRVASLLRLLGGEGSSLDFGLRGSMGQPSLIPLDSIQRGDWQRRVHEAGRKLAS